MVGCFERRGVAFLGLVILMVQGACAVTPPYREVPNYPLRFSDIRTITLVPPLVAVYSISSGDIEQEVQEWSDEANENARVAVQKRVEAMGRRYVPFAGSHGPLPDFRLGAENVNRSAPQTEAEASWLLFESAKEAILRHTYDPAQIFPDQIKGFDYTLGPEAHSLLAGTDADAFLLMIATDHVATADRNALIGVAAVAGLTTGSYAGPAATPAELIVALVDSNSGDILWFNRVETPLADLRNPESSDALVQAVFVGMAR
jgi:hypothetical protein